MSEKFYITTPIYYVNARPHIGHAYTTIVCDAIARRKRMLGYDTYFLTGTDEHGQKIERSATAAGKTPKQFADEVSSLYRQLFQRMNITNEVFAFVRSGLRDPSISRSTFKWGIPVPRDPGHVIYVWLDALSNYCTALGFGSKDEAEQEKFERYWPADVHMIGKEIIRFHCV